MCRFRLAACICHTLNNFVARRNRSFICSKEIGPASLGLPGTRIGVDFRREPAVLTSVWQILLSLAEQDSTAPAILGRGRAALTYDALRHQCEYAVRTLNAAGLGRGDRVAIVLPNGPEMATAFLGVSCGASSAPLNPSYTREELAFYLADLDARGVVVQAGVQSPVREIAEEQGLTLLELEPDAVVAGAFSLTVRVPRRPRTGGFAESADEALVLHTSGTTARPKIVPLTQANLTVSARNIAHSLALATTDRCLNVMPLFHIHGLVGALLSSMWSGASVFCTPGFAAADFLSLLVDSRATWYTAVPTMHQAIVEQSAKEQALVARHSLRFIRSCSSALAPQLMANVERVFGAPVVEAYGMTEASHQIAVNPLPPRIRKPGSVGVPSGTSVVVLDSAGNFLGAGETGELAVAGESVTSGYASNPDANANAFARGYFRTGDQGHLDADGYVFITGRIKEIINKGGEKIAPREIDEVLLQHPAVAQCVTFAAPHARLGEEVAAAVVLRAGLTATQAELQEFAGTRLASFKVPRRILMLPDLPKGPTGKLQRVGLAARLGVSFAATATQADAAQSAAMTGDEAVVARVMAEVLQIPALGAGDDFFDCGGESILALELTRRLSETLGIELAPDHVFRYPSPRHLAQVLPALRAGEEDDLDHGVVVFNEGGRRGPFFYLHAGSVSAGYCERLAQQLGPDQPVYGLPPFGGKFGPVPATVEEMADRYLELIDAAAPEGPVAIGGFCRSALPSLEIAHRLTAAGRKVELLVLIGGHVENTRGPWRLLQRVNNVFARLTGADALTRIGRFLRLRRLLEIVEARITGRAPAANACQLPAGNQPPAVTIPLRYARAGAAYVPRPYHGLVTCLSIETDPGDDRWSRIAPRRDAQTASGDHRTAFTVNAPLLSDQIRKALASARVGDGAPQQTGVPAPVPSIGS